MMPYADLFLWWVISISWSITFLVGVSIYLYRNSRPKRMGSVEKGKGNPKLRADFVFVWVLIGLLILYIVSINLGSITLFAEGNIAVESLLLAYLVKNRHKR